MAIAKRPGQITLPKTDPTGVVDKPNIVNNPSRRSEVDLEKLPYTRLLQHAEGFRWVVDVYRQIAGADNLKTEFDPFAEDPSQQYAEIKDYQIRLPSGIVPSQDTGEKVFRISSEAYDDFGLKLNEGDFFVAYTGNGNLVSFNITESERLSTLKDASYRISFEARQILTESDLANLQSKVVDSKVFSMEWLERTGKAIVDSNFNDKVKVLKKKGELLKDLYFRRYYFQSAKSLSIPCQGFPTNDPFLTRLVRYLDDNNEFVEYNYPPFDMDRIETIYSLVIKPREEVLPFLIKDFGIVDKTPFFQKVCFNSIGISQYSYSVWSSDIVQENQVYCTIKDLGRLDTDEFTPSMSANGLPYFNQVKLTPYVLSEDFYNGTGKSVLEVELLRYIRGENVSADTVLELVQEVISLSSLEQFYLLPLVLVLVYYVGE